MPISETADAEELRLLGVSRGRRRLFTEASEAFAALTRARPDDPTAWLSLARTSLLAGDVIGAKQACERALALDPEAIRAHLVLARLGTSTNDLTLRIGALKKAIALRPNTIALRVALIGAHLRRTNHMAAMTAAREAQALAPDDPTVLLALARCHTSKGQWAQAETLLARLEGSAIDATALADAQAELTARRRKSADPKEAVPALSPPGALTAGAPGETQPGRIKVGTGLASAPARQIDEPIDPRRADFTADEPPDRHAKNEDARASVASLASIRGRRRPGLIDHILIIRALILRDVHLHHRNIATALVAGLIRPSIVVLVHYWLFYFLRKPMPGNIPLVIYVLAGFAPWFAFSGAWTGAETGGKWTGGVTAFPGVTNLHLRVAKAVWQLLLNLVFCLLAVIPLQIAGWVLPFPNVPLTCLIFTIAGTMGYALGLILERLASLLAFVKTAGKLLSWAMFISSGLYFSIGTMPPIVAQWFLYNPLLHLIEFERHAFDPGYSVTLVDLRYPSIVTALLLVFGLLLYRRMPCKIYD